MAEPIRNAVDAAKDAVASATEAVANTTLASGDGASSKLIKDEETGEMVSKTECESLVPLMS